MRPIVRVQSLTHATQHVRKLYCERASNDVDVAPPRGCGERRECKLQYIKMKEESFLFHKISTESQRITTFRRQFVVSS